MEVRGEVVSRTVRGTLGRKCSRSLGSAENPQEIYGRNSGHALSLASSWCAHGSPVPSLHTICVVESLL